MMRHCTRFGRALGVLLGLWSSSLARAYDEQVSLDVAAGYTLLAGPSRNTAQGPGVELGVGFEVAPSIVVRGDLAYAALIAREGAPHAKRIESFGRLRVEALYQLDVLQVVPFFGLGATVGTAQDGSNDTPVRVGPHLVIGADYLGSRTWLWGVDLRTALLAQGHVLLNATDVVLRVSRLFETF